MSETVVLSDEQFVRERWESAHEYESLSGCQMIQFGPHSLGSWALARAYTEDRLEQIRQVEEEVDVVENQQRLKRKRVLERQCECVSCQVEAVCELCVVSRILEREQAVLAELRRGMR